MALPLQKLGTTYPPRTTAIDADRARRYAAATNDPNPAYEAGKLESEPPGEDGARAARSGAPRAGNRALVAPPVFGVVPTSECLAQAVELVPPEVAMFVVHGEQDMHFHQPLVPGRSITGVSEPYSVRVGGSGTRYSVTVASSDTGTGEPVLTQFFTLFIRGMVDGGSEGPDRPGHDFPEDARSRSVGEHAVHVDDDQTYRSRGAVVVKNGLAEVV